MGIEKMAEEYRRSARLLKPRVAQLKAEMRRRPDGITARRLAALEEEYWQLVLLARYLEGYYEKEDAVTQKEACL